MSKVLDSAIPWVAEHTRRYVESEGADGHIWNGAPTLVLTTTGRRSGRPRRNALIYGRDGDGYVIVASKGGHDHHPHWYLNLLEQPHVEIQVGAQHLRARARTVSESERQRLWPVMTKLWPDFDEYRGKAKRDIPVVVLDVDG